MYSYILKYEYNVNGIKFKKYRRSVADLHQFLERERETKYMIVYLKIVISKNIS